MIYLYCLIQSWIHNTIDSSISPFTTTTAAAITLAYCWIPYIVCVCVCVPVPTLVYGSTYGTLYNSSSSLRFCRMYAIGHLLLLLLSVHSSWHHHRRRRRRRCWCCCCCCCWSLWMVGYVRSVHFDPFFLDWFIGYRQYILSFLSIDWFCSFTLIPPRDAWCDFSRSFYFFHPLSITIVSSLFFRFYFRYCFLLIVFFLIRCMGYSWCGCWCGCRCR